MNAPADAVTRTGIEYLDMWERALAHQREHGSRVYGDQPDEMCTKCPRDRRGPEVRNGKPHDIKRAYSWAVPNEQALEAIGRHSPRGVVEIGAGGGYWAKLLRDRGVDVVAYDPDPAGGEQGWHSGRRWSEVLLGDHTAVIGHSDRALLLCWPSYNQPWTSEVVDLYGGDTVIYIGEGSGGCTGDDRMHALLGDDMYCYHDLGEPCDHNWPEARFTLVDTVAIPQWFGLHDRLHIYKRKVAA